MNFPCYVRCFYKNISSVGFGSLTQGIGSGLGGLSVGGDPFGQKKPSVAPLGQATQQAFQQAGGRGPKPGGTVTIFGLIYPHMSAISINKIASVSVICFFIPGYKSSKKCQAAE